MSAMRSSGNSDIPTSERSKLFSRRTAVLGLLGFLGSGVVLALNWRKFDRSVAQVGTPEGQKYLGTHCRAVLEIAFSPDGRFLASGGVEGTVKLWDLATGEERATLTRHTGPVEAVAFAPDGNTLVSGGGHKDGTVRLWDIRSGAQRTLFNIVPPVGTTITTRYVAFSPDGRTVASGSEINTGDHHLAGPLILWDINTGQQLYQGQILALARRAIAFTPDGKYLVVKGKGIRLIEVATGKEQAALEREGDGGLLGFGISSDGKTLVSLYVLDLWSKIPRVLHQTVVLWDLATYQPGASFTLPKAVDPAHSVAFSHDGKILATAGQDSYVRLWALPTGMELASFKGPGGLINAVCFSPDDKTIAFACDNGAVLLAEIKQPPGQ